MPYCATPRVARSFWFSSNQMVEHMFNFDTTIFSQSFAKWKKVTRTTETAVCFIGTFMTQLIICLLWTLQCCVTAARWSFTARLRVVDNIVLIISDHVDPAYILHIHHTQIMYFLIDYAKQELSSNSFTYLLMCGFYTTGRNSRKRSSAVWFSYFWEIKHV